MNYRLLAVLLAVAALGACSKELPPRTVSEFIENPILLEAAMVRCSRDRVETRYAAECVNAREAVKIISAREEAERRAELEAMSEQKRRAFRRVQDAAAEARRRAEEQKRLRDEAEYLAQFGVLPDGSVPEQTGPSVGNNVPGAILPTPEEEDKPAAGGTMDPADSPAATGANTPGASAADDDADTDGDASDLQSIRDELKRRQNNQGTP